MTVCKTDDGLAHHIDRKDGIFSCTSTLVLVRLLCCINHSTVAPYERGFRVLPKTDIVDGVPTCFGCLGAAL